MAANAVGAAERYGMVVRNSVPVDQPMPRVLIWVGKISEAYTKLFASIQHP